jgi:hypothetical protein
MEHVDLPVIAPDASLANAIELMKNKGRSGVLVALKAAPRVVDVDIVLHTIRSKGNLAIGTVLPRDTTIVLGDDSSAGMVMANPDAQRKVRDLMDNARAIYALAGGVGGDYADILTRHEGFRHMLYYATQMWRCKQDANHVWAYPDLYQPGNKCRNELSDTELI